MTTRTRLAIIIVTAPVLAFVVVGGLLARTRGADEAYPHLRVFDDVFSLTTNGYVEAVDPGRLMHGAMHGLAEALDADSAYLKPDEARLAEGRAPLPAGDVGLVLTRQYYLRVAATVPGSPAARAGIRSGDYIRVMDRQPTRDLSVWAGTRMLRGAVGAPITLTVLRGNATEPHVVSLVREPVAVPPPAATLATNGIGLIRLSAITEDTPAAVRAHVTALQNGGARSLIVDLRGCASGPLAAGIETARLFVSNGAIGHLDTRGASRQTFTAATGDGTVTSPLVVLVDAGTSGPAELVAAAVQGHKRGDLVGERTGGRTALQRLFPLPDGSALWMSYAQYLSVSGDPIHGRGLQPDVVVEQPDVEFGAAPPTGDVTVERAIERLRARSGS
ncbi:MAG: S41 family peptidase [Vicinamibacterales bacterium]|nr:S41 family peptidase [Vicinamibacterales bacterium]